MIFTLRSVSIPGLHVYIWSLSDLSALNFGGVDIAIRVWLSSERPLSSLLWIWIFLCLIAFIASEPKRLPKWSFDGLWLLRLRFYGRRQWHSVPLNSIRRSRLPLHLWIFSFLIFWLQEIIDQPQRFLLDYQRRPFIKMLITSLNVLISLFEFALLPPFFVIFHIFHIILLILAVFWLLFFLFFVIFRAIRGFFFLRVVQHGRLGVRGFLVPILGRSVFRWRIIVYLLSRVLSFFFVLADDVHICVL